MNCPNKNIDRIIKQTINEAVGNIILEYGGVSDDVINESDLILNEVLKQSENYEWRYNELIGQHTKRFTIELNKGIAKGVYVRLYGYDPRNQSFADKLEELEELGYLNLSFGISTKLVKLSIPYPLKGELEEYGKEYLVYSINHEVKHALQDSKRGYTNVTNTYQKAIERRKIDDKKPEMYLIKSYIRDLYYVLDSDEIDARLQEIYIELRNFGDLNKSKAYQRLKKAKEEYNWLYNVLYPSSAFDVKYYQDLREQFPQILTDMLGEGITTKQFIRYCQNGISKFDEQLRRVIGRYRTENNITNGSFAQYAKNEIPMRDMFVLKKENPSLWKRLMTRFGKKFR